jgi:hypothetical protein
MTSILPERYSVENIRGALAEPSRFVDELKRLNMAALSNILNPYFVSKYGYGFGNGDAYDDLMAEEWDNLFILDACRLDYFREKNHIDGNLSARTSLATWSWEFMEQNFVGRDLHDTVYVTSNPYVERLDEDVFYTVENLLHDWDKEMGTVHPGTVVEAARDAHERYPNKRLIIHFMQPHVPWIGPTADAIRERVNGLKGWDRYGYNRDGGKTTEREGIGDWEAVKEGHITTDELGAAYQESLQIALEHIEDLLNDLNGDSVVTADHGEMLGDQVAPFTPKLYGHNFDTYCSELCRLPWLEVPGDEDRETIAEDPIGFDRLADDKVSERLADLGYLDEA